LVACATGKSRSSGANSQSLAVEPQRLNVGSAHVNAPAKILQS
jgi:hypothetical protein